MNARIMRNCTARLVDKIVDGSAFLVVVHDPRGRRYNVAILRDRSRFKVGQVNSWANGGVEPSWIRTAFQSLLDQEEAIPGGDGTPRAERSATTHRDRRRARARSARR